MSAKNQKKRKLEDISNSEKVNKNIKNTNIKPTVQMKSQTKSDDKKKNGQLLIVKEKQQRSSSNQKIKEDKKLITNKKHQEILEERSEEINLTSAEAKSQVIIGNMFSLYDEIFQHKDNSEEFVVKTMFLYFLEIMGLADPATLQYDVQYIAKNIDEKKLLGLFKQDEKFEIEFDKIIFFSHEKKALEQKKLLKRVCKIFVADVVDILPDKESYLTSVVQRICVFAKSPQRLVRYAFTYVGLYMYKFLLGQHRDLAPMRQQLEEKQKREAKEKRKSEAEKTQKQLEAIQDALGIIKACLVTLEKHVILNRCQDTHSLIRKSVYDFLLSLDEKEITQAFNQDSKDLIEIVFGSLRDEEQQIKKIGLVLLNQLLSKLLHKEIIERNFEKNKLQIFKLAIPSETHQDAALITRALQLIQKMIKLNPKIYNGDHLQILSNLVHYQNQAVREEVGDLLLILSDEFDDQNSLMELQKIHQSKNNYDEFIVNFNEEPNKSQKQIIKLIKMFEKQVQTRSQFIRKVNPNEDDSDIQIPNMRKEQVQRILQTDSEERAILLFQTFHRKTSVIFDIQSMITLLKKEEQDESKQQVLVNLINASLSYCKQQRKIKENPNLIYSKIWDISVSFLKLSVINELLQTFRVNYKILDPLLKILMSVSKHLEKDNQNDQQDEMGKDLTLLLLKVIHKTDVDESQSETQQIIKNSILCLAQLQQYFPFVKKEIQELALNFNDQLQHVIVPQLFQRQEKIPHNLLSQLFKYNILMSQTSLKQVSDSEYLKGIASFAITNFTQMILDNHHLVKDLSRSQLQTLIQAPFILLDQLLNLNQLDARNIDFQRKMICNLVDFYMQLYNQLKVDENLQVVVLSFIIECIILGGGESRSAKESLIISIGDFQGMKEFLIELIQNVASRIKGNEILVQEQFQLLLHLFNKDFNSLLSEIGVEFLINFGTSKDASILKEIRKLYYGYKQRDRLLMNTKQGIFYTFIAKCIIGMFSLHDSKVSRLIDVAPGDLVKEMNQQGFDQFNPPFTLSVYQKLTLIQNFVKTFLNSIMLLIISNKSPDQIGGNGLTKQQDELAYFKMVETLIRQSFTDKENFALLLSVKFFMHKNFLNQKQQDGLLKGVKSFIETQKEKLQLTEEQIKMLNFIVQKIEDKVNVRKVAKKMDETTVQEQEQNKEAINQSLDEQSKENIVQSDKEDKREREETITMIGKKRKAQSSGDQSEKKAKENAKQNVTVKKQKKEK